MSVAMQLLALAAAALPAWHQAVAGRLAGQDALTADDVGAGSRAGDCTQTYMCGGISAAVEHREDWDGLGHFTVRISNDYLGTDNEQTIAQEFETRLGIEWRLLKNRGQESFKLFGTSASRCTCEEALHTFSGVKHFVHNFTHEHDFRHWVRECDAPDGI